MRDLVEGSAVVEDQVHLIDELRDPLILRYHSPLLPQLVVGGRKPRRNFLEAHRATDNLQSGGVVYYHRVALLGMVSYILVRPKRTQKFAEIAWPTKARWGLEELVLSSKNFHRKGYTLVNTN